MSHLNPERLAELADGTPTAEESAHLAVCPVCAHERRAHEAVLELARRTGEHELPPLTTFEVLAEQLRLEGRTSSGGGRSRVIAAWWMRAAAAVLLVVSGVAVGRWSASAPGGAASVTATADTTHTPSFASADDARATLVRAERDYRGALTWLAQNDSAASLQSPDAYRARLAVLDEIAGAARRGVDEAPYDPMLSQYYLSTLAARQATLEQLGGALPSGVRLTQF